MVKSAALLEDNYLCNSRLKGREIMTQSDSNSARPILEILAENNSKLKERLGENNFPSGFDCARANAIRSHLGPIFGKDSPSLEFLRKLDPNANKLELGEQIKDRVALVDIIIHHLQRTSELSLSNPKNKIFIGHGRSQAWRDLKDFLDERLGLQWVEFNRDPTAGLTTSERLNEMLDVTCFAFLVMTAEEEHKDSNVHARPNVIHEIGLFQGRLGLRKAIILLEDGCSEFSNIIGLTQIRFPRGDLSAKFEEIRKVLEREGLMKSK